MTSKKDQIDEMMGKLFGLGTFDQQAQNNIRDFVDTAINGDEIVTSHILVVGKDKEEVYVVFVLTNVRLIKVEIGPTNKTSEEFPLDSIKIEWVSNEYEGIKISSLGKSISIKNIDEEDTAFFKAVGEARAKIGTSHAKF